jgi:hypothetical protein
MSVESQSLPDAESADDLSPESSLPQTSNCLNCSHPVSGHFCMHCGQENEDRNVALKLLLADLLSDVISFDSKLFRTVLPLLFRPGFLTNEYNAGRRVRYLAPLKLYLTLSVLFFLVFSWRPPIPLSSMVSFDDKPRAQAAKKHHDALVISGPGDDQYNFSTLTLKQYDAMQRDPKRHDSHIEQFFIRHAIKVHQNPTALVQGFLDDIPKVMFLLLPVFAGLYKLVYLRSKRLYVEHLIFLLHCHAVAFLVMTLLLFVPPGWPDILLIGGLVLYLLVALKVVYKQSWLKTMVKFGLLSFNYLLLLVFCILGALLVALIFV